jgi:hypothetical protein
MITTLKYVVGCEYFGLEDTIFWLGSILLLKIDVVVDIEKGFMYMCNTLGKDVQLFPLNMINLMEL